MKNCPQQNATYDPQIVKEIKQHPIQDLLGATPQKEEIKKAISKMRSDKAPGVSQLTTDAEKPP